jgi:ABC-type sugar transport system ATPase subunit
LGETGDATQSAGLSSLDVRSFRPLMRPTSSFPQLELQFVNFCLKADDDKIRFREIEGGRIEVAFAAADRPAAHEFISRSVILGIRPEDLEVAKFIRKEGKAVASGFSAIVESMGAETNLYLQTGAHALVCRSRGALDHREAGTPVPV